MEGIKRQLQFYKNQKEALLLNVKNVEIKIQWLENAKEINIPQLAKELSEIKNLKTAEYKNFKIKTYKGQYTNILGGDGRSQPWDEKKQGIIIDFSSSYYLEKKHQDFIQSYLKELGEFNSINFI